MFFALKPFGPLRRTTLWGRKPGIEEPRKAGIGLKVERDTNDGHPLPKLSNGQFGHR